MVLTYANVEPKVCYSHTGDLDNGGQILISESFTYMFFEDKEHLKGKQHSTYFST